MFTLFKIKHLSIFMRILSAFLLVFLPLYIISIVVNILGANNIMKEISHSMLNQTEDKLKNLEEDIIHIFETQGVYMADRDFSKMAFLADTLSDSERFINIDNIRNKLNMIKLNSKIVKGVKVYISGSGLTLRDSNSVGDIDKGWLREMMHAGTFPFIYRDGGLFLNPYGSSFYKGEELPSVNFSVELSIVKIRDSLLDFMHYEKGGAVLLGEDQEWMITKKSYEGAAKEEEKEEEEKEARLVREILERNLPAMKRDTITPIKVDGEKFIAVYKESPYLNSALLVYIPEKELLGPIEDYRKWLWIISFLACFEIVLFSNLLHRLIQKPLVTLLSAFKKVEEGVLDISIQHMAKDEFQHIYFRFNRMIEKLKQLINQTYEQKLLVKNTELKQLQNQINTHFLYNCFFILSRLIKFQDTDNAGRLTHHLAIYYQFITRNSFELIPLHKEVEHVKSYAEIQNFRFSGRIVCSLGDTPENLKDMPVPRLILQPLVENCFKHGLKSKDAGGSIIVDISEKNGYLCISVEDNGEELEDEKLAELQKLASSSDETGIEVTGLLNIHRRIRIKYGEDCGLFFSRSQLGGLCAQLKMLVAARESEAG